MLAFDIAQFFPLLNHQIPPLILHKAGFDPKFSVFLQDYLIKRKTSDNNIQPIIPSIAKGRLWLKYFGHSNLFYIKASRAIVNHILIDRYQLRFFPREIFDCPCGSYSIESRQHILYKCKIYNNYWNPR